MPLDHAGSVRRAAAKHSAVNVSVLASDNGACALVIAQLENAVLESFLDELDQTKLHVTFAPQGVLALYPPVHSAPDQVTDVASRSPLEVYLSGLQSVGSWKGFLGYAAAAGAVVWIGLFTGTIYLLVAAMLIAPYAGPAMNAALATARGDVQLFLKSVRRYFAGLVVSVVVSLVLSLLLQQEQPTTLMVDTSLVSASAILLPLVAGAAGALNLCQSDRTSLVSGAATGMLVAASLAPQAGLIGMSLAIGRADLIVPGLFVLALQLVGINLSGAAVFWMFGIRPSGPRFNRGQAWFRSVATGGSLIAVMALLYLQFAHGPGLQESTREQRINGQIARLLGDSGVVQFLEANTRFTRVGGTAGNTVISEVYVQPMANGATGGLERELERLLSANLQNEFDITPLVNVTVLPPPGAQP